ncbi:MAG: C39 family peptidase [Turicibacter sanguinis]|uniref:C39 family peptidase n=1 Tax=Turicibacter sanguinis TaxID=154288 RepID=UPI0021D50AE9|nr:C39 family peptidase [Turicibacter sanguinis]MCU7197373.1 C39 family peptidase [Turicibacter sanguinis]
MKKFIYTSLGILMMMLLLTLYFLSPFPKHGKIPISFPSSFSIEQENSFETQIINECSAFSIAYVLRHYHESQTGLNIYHQLNYKIPVSGYVLPKGILNYFKDSVYNIEMFTGSLETLKTRLTAGTPIIVLIGNSLNWQHYMTLVGYDDTTNEMYFFDSLKSFDENNGQPGNRTITTDYFLKLWNNGLPIFNQLYFTISTH